jgi:hypothetical protein
MQARDGRWQTVHKERAGKEEAGMGGQHSRGGTGIGTMTLVKTSQAKS